MQKQFFITLINQFMTLTPLIFKTLQMLKSSNTLFIQSQPKNT